MDAKTNGAGKVDVLAVMDAACCVLAIDRKADPQRQLEQARAAIAELIESATELRARQRDYLSQPKGERVEQKGRLVGEAAARLDAALARVEAKP